MKTVFSSVSVRRALGAFLMLSGLALFCALPLIGTAQSPSNGTITPGTVGAVTWVGTTISPGGATDEASCQNGINCEVYTLTVGGTKADWVGAGKRVQVLLNWQTAVQEFDIYIHKGNSTSGPLVTSAIQGPGQTTQLAFIDIGQWDTGTFTIHVAYSVTPASAADPYHGNVSAVSSTPIPAPPAPQDNGPKVGYENFEAPGVLTQVTGTSNGGLTVEYLGRNAGEPSVGANWATGVINLQSDLQTLFITFDDTCPAPGLKATWVNRRAPTSQVIDSDPIGFTDRQTHRVFASELTALSPDTAKLSYSDDDGVNWTPSPQGSGIASAVDHQTIGGGPYRTDLTAVPPVVPPPHPLYANATYYCSQDIAAALASRSDDGGLTFGASVPIYNLTQCGGLHGHLKVAPDGTAFVPNKDCNGEGAVAVSENNGVSWEVRQVRSTTVNLGTSVSDPSVATDAANRIYFAHANNDNSCVVALSDDHGRTWHDIVDVAAVFGLKNVKYPTAVGGDAGRAAVAFYGSTTPGTSEDGSFTGFWHLYVAHTFDGGATWTTTDVTPNFPIQRGGIWTQGGGNIYRNLLDFFDVTIDAQGRVIVGYVNGCAGGNCAQAAPSAVGNAFTATATIARQSSGRRLLAAFDPPSPSVPGMPFVTQRRNGATVRLSWSEADTGNSPLTSYQLLRGTASGAETLLATLPPTQTRFVDVTATNPSASYYYKVVAVNALGASCANNEIVSSAVGDLCNGLLIHQNPPDHPEATGGQAGNPPAPQLLIDTVSVGEPYRAGSSLFLFKMKVGNLNTVPPNSRWRMVWDTPASPGQQFYTGMTSDANGAVTFEYGTLATAVVGLIVGVPQETKIAAADLASNYNADGTITIYVPKSGVGNPQPGDLLGAFNGRTFTGDTPETNTLERSTSLIDHTFVKAQTDNSFPAATYTVTGNVACGLASAVSRKTHGSAGNFDVPLPTSGTPGIECRTGPTAGNHQIVVTFASPVSFTNGTGSGATVTPGPGGSGAIAGTPTVNGNQVTVNLTGVSNAQTLALTLAGITDGVATGDVLVPASFLLGDTTADGFVNAGDTSQTKARSGQAVTAANFRSDVNADGNLNAGDASLVKANSGTALPQSPGGRFAGDIAPRATATEFR